MHLVVSVCPSVCNALLLEPFDKNHYQFKVFVCVSVISGRMRIIARMRSIGVLIFEMIFPQAFDKLFDIYCILDRADSLTTPAVMGGAVNIYDLYLGLREQKNDLHFLTWEAITWSVNLSKRTDHWLSLLITNQMRSSSRGQWFLLGHKD